MRNFIRNKKTINFHHKKKKNYIQKYPRFVKKTMIITQILSHLQHLIKSTDLQGILVADVVQHLRLSATFKDNPQRTDFQIEGQPFHYRITQSFSWLYSMLQKMYIHFL